MATMMLEVPERLKTMRPAIEKLLRDVDARCRRASDGRSFDCTAFEALVRDDCAAIEREAHGVALAALDIDAAHVKIGGALHARVGRHETTFMTQVGGVSVTRSLYRKTGERNFALRRDRTRRSTCRPAQRYLLCAAA